MTSEIEFAKLPFKISSREYFTVAFFTLTIFCPDSLSLRTIPFMLIPVKIDGESEE